MYGNESASSDDDVIDVERLVIDYSEDAGDVSAETLAAHVMRQLRQVLEEA